MDSILVVEDDGLVNDMICDALSEAGYHPESAYSGKEAVRMLEEKPWKCIILDLMLPGASGEEVLDAIRKLGRIPVIVVSAKVEKESKLSLLASGADDYITKPFDIDELIARVAAQIRRFTVYTNDEKDKFLRYLDIHMDLNSRTVFVGETQVNLTGREFDILALLLKYPQKVFSRSNIFESVWNEDFLGDEKTINVHISNLRAKLAAVSEYKHIKTIWGIGFRLAH